MYKSKKLLVTLIAVVSIALTTSTFAVTASECLQAITPSYIKFVDSNCNKHINLDNCKNYALIIKTKVNTCNKLTTSQNNKKQLLLTALNAYPRNCTDPISCDAIYQKVEYSLAAFANALTQ